MTAQLNKFVAFLSRYHLIQQQTSEAALAIPKITAIHLIFFMGYLELAKHSTYESIQAYASSVRTWCKMQGRPDPGLDPATDKPDINYYNYCRALKRKLAGKTNKRTPLTLAQLDKIIDLLNRGSVCPASIGQNMKAAITTAFCLMLRISEYTTTGAEGHIPGVTASRNDIQFFPSLQAPQGFTFRINKSKTDQFRVGSILTVHATPGSPLCPVAAMKTLFDSQPAPLTAPLFNFGAVRQASASRSQFINWFVKLLTTAGINTDYVKPHSLRSGGATAYLAAGTDPYVIQKLGRWASWCFTIYTQLNAITVKDSQTAMLFGPRIHKAIDLSPVRQEILPH